MKKKARKEPINAPHTSACRCILICKASLSHRMIYPGLYFDGAIQGRTLRATLPPHETQSSSLLQNEPLNFPEHIFSSLTGDILCSFVGSYFSMGVLLECVYRL